MDAQLHWCMWEERVQKYKVSVGLPSYLHHKQWPAWLKLNFAVSHMELSRDIGVVAQPWRRLSPHGESRRGLAKPSPWRAFYDGDIVATATPVAIRLARPVAIWRDPSPSGETRRHLARPVAIWRDPSPFGETRHHLATPVAIWRHPSPFGDGCRYGETAPIT